MSLTDRQVFCPACCEMLQWRYDDTWKRHLLFCPHTNAQFPLQTTELIELSLRSVPPPNEKSVATPNSGPWYCPNCANHLESREGGTFMCNACGFVIGAVLQHVMQNRVGHSGRDI